MDNYPVDMSDCDKVGMNGGCGDTCPVFMDGNCEYKTGKDDENVRTQTR